jgi:outer membrane protein OmpA-like peptidoglycan-associated protein
MSVDKLFQGTENNGMRNTIKPLVAAISTLCMATSFAAFAEENEGWKFELTPYVWAAGIEGDVKIRDHEGSVDASFSDVLDHLDMAAAFLGTAQYNSWVTWLQVDYMDLSQDISRKVVNGSLDTKMTLLTGGFGYQFQGWSEKQTFDVLLGARNLKLESELKLDTVGTFDGDKNFTTPVIIVRPSIQLSKRWRFNPTLSYGKGGDVDKTYELQPQFQFQAWENAAFRFGYRKLYYKIESDNGNTFDGSFQGPFIGFGFTFGGSKPTPVVEPAPAPKVVAAPPPPPPKDTDGDGVPDGKDQCPNTPKGQTVDSNGCGYNINVEVTFDTNSSVIKSDSYSGLDRAVDLLKRVPSMRGVIEGYTDATGSDAYNLKLSERRAAAVSDYLAKHGIDAARVPSKGFGEAQPIADNKTAEGRAQNRRVVLRRTDSGG